MQTALSLLVDADCRLSGKKNESQLRLSPTRNEYSQLIMIYTNMIITKKPVILDKKSLKPPASNEYSVGFPVNHYHKKHHQRTAGPAPTVPNGAQRRNAPVAIHWSNNVQKKGEGFGVPNCNLSDSGRFPNTGKGFKQLGRICLRSWEIPILIMVFGRDLLNNTPMIFFSRSV